MSRARTGRRRGIEKGVAAAVYGRLNQYDGLYRLTGSGSASYGGDHWHRFTYDAVDNLTSWKLGGVKDHARYAYGAADNRLVRIDNTAGTQQVGLTYDVQGNLASKNGKVARFDYGNRLRSMDAQGAGLESYRYDGLGRRVLAWRSADSTITLSQYSQAGQLLYQENSKTALISEHVYLAGSLIATQELPFNTTARAVKYQHTDALGSPVAVTNQAGQVLGRTQWEPYGAAIGRPGYDGVGYTGHVMDGATGLTYMQQRYYDPSIGRFLSVDPVTADANTGANFNRYAYANNNPYKFVDPDGRAPNKLEAVGPAHVARILGEGDLMHLQRNPGGGRYFYTDKFGWVDIKHFTETAHRVINGQNATLVRALGFMLEVRQRAEDTSQHQSGFGPEDLPSNAAGIDFAETVFVGEDMRSAFLRWGRLNGAREPSDPEAGYAKLPEKDPSRTGGREAGMKSNYSSSPIGIRVDRVEGRIDSNRLKKAGGG